MKHLIAIIFVALLTGCGTLGDLTGLAGPAVQITDSLTGESTTGSTKGLSSSDAAFVLAYRSYIAAIKAAITAPAQPILEIIAHDGQQITINAKELRVYAPPSHGQGQQIAQPTQPEPAGILWFREIRQALAQVFVPWAAGERAAETQRLQITTNAGTRAQELELMGQAVQGSQAIAGQAIDNYEPTVIQIPAAPAAP